MAPLLITSLVRVNTVIFIDCRMVSASAMRVKQYVSDTNVCKSNQRDGTSRKTGGPTQWQDSEIRQ
jgi:hypothetical protein